MSSRRGRSPCDTSPRQYRLEVICPGTLVSGMPDRRGFGRPQSVEYLTVAHVATELNVNVSQVRTLIRIGSLPATGNRQGHRLIERLMRERWIQDLCADTRRFVLELDPSGRWVRVRGVSGGIRVGVSGPGAGAGG